MQTKLNTNISMANSEEIYLVYVVEYQIHF